LYLTQWQPADAAAAIFHQIHAQDGRTAATPAFFAQPNPAPPDRARVRNRRRHERADTWEVDLIDGTMRRHARQL
jgi:hypothetical protein